MSTTLAMVRLLLIYGSKDLNGFTSLETKLNKIAVTISAWFLTSPLFFSPLIR